MPLFADRIRRLVIYGKNMCEGTAKANTVFCLLQGLSVKQNHSLSHAKKMISVQERGTYSHNPQQAKQERCNQSPDSSYQVTSPPIVVHPQPLPPPSPLPPPAANPDAAANATDCHPLVPTAAVATIAVVYRRCCRHCSLPPSSAAAAVASHWVISISLGADFTCKLLLVLV